ncbi:MAG: glycosyltransferase [Myxococcales bacterium]
MNLDIVILGLSITSSWGNGHATTYRGLVRELARRGHRVRFLERDAPWYAANRDMPRPPWGETHLYSSMEELKETHRAAVRDADLVIVGSFVPLGAEAGEWVLDTARGLTAFYDIDTPVTVAKIARGEFDYLTRDLISRYDLYLSFTGGPVLRHLERELGARRARPLYCSVDPELYKPAVRTPHWDLGYLGTYSDDRQPVLERLLLRPAEMLPEGRFVVAGPQYPPSIRWPANVERIVHLSPREHAGFYNGQRFTLNVTRADMVRWGWSPSVRLFEAAACGVPIISDVWPGLETLFKPAEEILLAREPGDTLRYLRELPEDERKEVGARARARVMASHTAAHRALELLDYVGELRSGALQRSGS